MANSGSRARGVRLDTDKSLKMCSAIKTRSSWRNRGSSAHSREPATSTLACASDREARRHCGLSEEDALDGIPKQVCHPPAIKIVERRAITEQAEGTRVARASARRWDARRVKQPRPAPHERDAVPFEDRQGVCREERALTVPGYACRPPHQWGTVKNKKNPYKTPTPRERVKGNKCP